MTLRDLHRAEDGVSLLEILVVVIVLSIVLGVTAGIAITVQRTSAGLEGRLDDLGRARVAIDSTTSALRTAIRIPGQATPLLPESTAFDVRFHANIASASTTGPSFVRMYLQGDRLVQEVTPPTPSGDTYRYEAANRHTHILARGLDPSRPLLRYCRAGSCAASTMAAEADGVEMTLVVGGAGRAPVELRHQVRIVNRDYEPPEVAAP